MQRTYSNPIVTGFFPDPSIIRVGEDYYILTLLFIFSCCCDLTQGLGELGDHKARHHCNDYLILLELRTMVFGHRISHITTEPITSW